MMGRVILRVAAALSMVGALLVQAPARAETCPRCPRRATTGWRRCGRTRNVPPTALSERPRLVLVVVLATGEPGAMELGGEAAEPVARQSEGRFLAWFVPAP